MSAGFQARCTMSDPSRCKWESGIRGSLYQAIAALLAHRNAAHSHGAPWFMEYTDPRTDERVTLA